MPWTSDTTPEALEHGERNFGIYVGLVMATGIVVFVCVGDADAVRVRVVREVSSCSYAPGLIRDEGLST